MLKKAELYWMAKCSTCQKAKAFLEDNGVEITLVYDMKETPLALSKIKELAEKVGGVEALFSKRSMKYRAWGLNEKELSEAEMLENMEKEYTFIRRPVIVFEDGSAFAGFAPKKLEAYLKG